jgi:hypothetical protein
MTIPKHAWTTPRSRGQIMARVLTQRERPAAGAPPAAASFSGIPDESCKIIAVRSHYGSLPPSVSSECPSTAHDPGEAAIGSL